jgi:hypothetical protein
VNKLENKIFCGPQGVYGPSLPTGDAYFTTTTNYNGGGFHEPWDLATYEASANYYPGLICPDAAHMTTSNMVMGFVSANNQSLGGGTGTWSVYVTSMLPVRNVSFYVDGSSTPIVAPQELQDVNSAFATTHQWLYHATFSTSSLSAGSHTIKAVATDVTKTTQTVSQTFSR